jgi:hypothetical protein
MGILSDIWWFTGVLLALKPTMVGLRMLESGDAAVAAAWFVLALAALFLPEYIRWRLFGGRSVLERLPRVGVEKEA